MNFGSLQSPLRRTIRITMLFAWILLWMPVFYPAYYLKAPFHMWLVKIFSKGMNWIMGVKLVIHGKPVCDRPVLFVSNHASYFDIYVLAAQLPAVFLAKDEILGWPGIGGLTKLSGSVFISRQPAKTLENIQLIKASPAKSFILFPEGTTSDGNRVKKFNSAFFSLVEQLGVAVQPVTIAYTRIANIPMGSHYRPYFSWFGDMELVPHVRDSFSFSSLTAEVTYHPLIEGEVLKDRKKLAVLCEQQVALAMAGSLNMPKKPQEKGKKPAMVTA